MCLRTVVLSIRDRDGNDSKILSLCSTFYRASGVDVSIVRFVYKLSKKTKHVFAASSRLGIKKLGGGSAL